MVDKPPSKPPGFAPVDYSDGRDFGSWETRYPAEARNCIRWESIYLALISLGYLGGVFWILAHCPNETLTERSHLNQPLWPSSGILFSALAAWSAGALGGCCFGIKWMYHSVAKQLWNKDRTLWRLFSPHISGVVSLFMVLLVESNLLRIFDEAFARRPIGVLAFSFLVGYFSDKAIAKMAEVADTIFGGSKSDGKKPHSGQHPSQGQVGT